MAKREPETFSPREGHLMKRQRDEITIFKRICGPNRDFLGKLILKELLVIVENTTASIKNGRYPLQR